MLHLRFVPVLVLLGAAPALPAQTNATSAAWPPPPVTTASPLVDPGATPSAYVPPGYVEVWGDEFNEKSLDTSKWFTRYIYNNGMLDRLNDEQERFRENNNHVLTGTTLDLTARKVRDNDPKKINYESGMVRSKVVFKYGYFEARLKMPPGKGMWPAFWLNSDADANGRVSWPPEIDIFEFVNNGKDDRPDMLHIGAVSRKAKAGSAAPQQGERLWTADAKIFKPNDPKGVAGYYYAPYKFPDDYHVFGLLWDTDDTVTWYVDGVELIKAHYLWKLSNGQDAPYAHVLLCLAMGGQWAGRYGMDDAAFPQALSVDYCRVYQKPGQERMGQSLIGHDLYKAP